MLYFAYGSNMSSPRLIARVGALRVLGLAELEGYRHRFSKRGKDGTGKGNVEPEAGARVRGVLYALEPAQLERLRGFESGYREVEFELEFGFGPQVSRGPTRRWPAVSFEALAVVRGLEPTPAYLEHYRAGMREHAMPLDYRAQVLKG